MSKIVIKNINNIFTNNTIIQNVLMDFTNFKNLFNEMDSNIFKTYEPYILQVSLYPFDLEQIFKNNQLYGLTAIGGTGWTEGAIYLKSLDNQKNLYYYGQLDLTNFDNNFINNQSLSLILQLPFCDDFKFDNNFYLGKIIKIYLSFDFDLGNLRVVLTDMENNLLNFYDNQVNFDYEITTQNNALKNIATKYNQVANIFNDYTNINNFFNIATMPTNTFNNINILKGRSKNDFILDNIPKLKIIKNEIVKNDLYLPDIVNKIDYIGNYLNSGKLIANIENFNNFDNLDSEILEKIKEEIKKGVIL